MRKILFILLLLFVVFNLNAQCFKQVSAGARHTVAIKNDSTLWVWGYNYNGELGDGTNLDRNNPVQVGTDRDWISVSAGTAHTLAIKANGTLWAWGYNYNGALGDGTIIDRKIPKQIGTSNNWAVISGGGNHSVGIKTDGTLWVWGYNNSGQLGDGTTIDKTTPTQLGVANNWRSVEAGLEFTMAIKTDGTLWAWGSNSFGQLGDGTNVSKNIPTQIGTANNWIRISAGDVHSLGIKNNNTIWSWGSNVVGQLGDGTNTDKNIPTQIGTANNWNIVSAESYQSFSIKTNGTLWAWGYNSSGQLGDGTTIDKNIPTQIGIANNWSSVDAGSTHTSGLKTDGYFWTWGENNYGQLGNGTNNNNIVPNQIIVNNTYTVTACDSFIWAAKGNKVYTASNNTDTAKLKSKFGCDSIIMLNLTVKYSTHNVTVKVTNKNFVWATNGQTYTSSGIYTYNYTNIQGCVSVDTLKLTINGNTDCYFKQVSAGENFSLAIKSNGTLWAWGANSSGQLGDGTNVDKNTPIQIGYDNNWKIVSAGGSHSLAIKTDGTLWAWGWNRDGQLGDWSTNDKNIPVQIGSGNNWLSVSAGHFHSVAIKTDGTLWTWGDNTEKQLGYTGYAIRDIPTQVGTANNWKMVSAHGALHNVALKTDGTLWAWGDNYSGEIGNGLAPYSQTIPVQIGTSNDWLMVEANSFNTVAIKTNGTLWAWGENTKGQLGDGTNVGKNIPTQIGTSNNWKNVIAGSYYTIATKNNNTLWAWGSNSSGQLGDGTSVDKNIPTQIGTDTNWNSISAGYHTTAIKNDSSLWIWGYNYYGSLGDGTNVDKNSPNSFICPSKSCYNVAGNLLSPNLKNIKNVLIKILGSNTYSKLYSNSYLDSCNNVGTNYTLRPTKNNDITKANGVTSIDALLTQRHILNSTKLNSPYKIIAADVDGNKVVNSVDVLRMKRLILGTDTTFTKTVGTVKTDRLWEFVDSAYTFPDTTNPFPFKDSISFTNLTSNKTNQTFIGVKLGDVNYDWNPAVARGVTANSLELIVNSEKTTNNNLKLVFTSSNFNNIAALQTTLHFDNTKYEFVSIESNKLQIDYNANKANKTGNIAVLWTDENAEAKSFDKDEVLFTIVLKPRSLGIDNLEFVVSNDMVETEAWDNNSAKRSIVLTQKAKSNKQEIQNNLLVYPNPAKDKVIIESVGAKQILIVDYLGRPVLSKTITNNQKLIMVNLPKGIYTIRVLMKDESLICRGLVVI